MNDDTGHYEGALLEELRDDLQRFAESMAEVPGDVRRLKSDMLEVKSRLITVELVVTDLSAVLLSHDKRLSKLEH